MVVPSASRQCLFWHPEICSWLFWGKSAISFDSNRIILGMSVWGEQLTNQGYKLDCDFGIKVSVRRAVLVWSIGCLGSCWVMSWGLSLYWKSYCSVAHTGAESEVFGKADQQILGWPRTCGGVHILARTRGCILLWGLRLGGEGDKDWNCTELEEVLCHKHPLSHWQLQCLWMTCLTCIWILFSSLYLFWVSAIQGSVLEQLHTYGMNLVLFFLSSIKRLKGNLKRSIPAFIWLAQLIFSLMPWTSTCCWKQVCAHAPEVCKRG